MVRAQVGLEDSRWSKLKVQGAEGKVYICEAKEQERGRYVLLRSRGRVKQLFLY